MQFNFFYKHISSTQSSPAMNWSTLEIFTEGVKNRMDYSCPNPNHREEKQKPASEQ